MPRLEHHKATEPREDPSEEDSGQLLNIPTGDSAEDQLRERGIYYINSEIKEGSLLEIHQDILLKHCTPTWEDDHGITLVINSAGGQLSPVWALIDLLDFIRMPVTTVAMGSCHSAATMLLAAGTRRRRIAAANTTLMVHRFTWGDYDKQAELIEHRKAEDQEHERIAAFYLARTRYKSRKELERKLLRPVDTWLTATQARQHGLIDHVLANKTDRYNPWKALRKAAEKQERERRKR